MEQIFSDEREENKKKKTRDEIITFGTDRMGSNARLRIRPNCSLVYSKSSESRAGKSATLERETQVMVKLNLLLLFFYCIFL